MIEPVKQETTIVQAQVKFNSGFRPITKKRNKMIEQIKIHPERRDWIRQSLQEYLLIKKSNYLNRRRNMPTEDDIFRCECISSLHATRSDWLNSDVSIDCGPKCLNKLMSTECEKSTCPCGITCQNRNFQLHNDACVFPKPMGGKGFGLIAGEKIKKGQFVIQYIGEVVNLNSEEGSVRIDAYSKSTCTYMMKLAGSEVIDPTYKGNMARFINHSCDPNCETQKWNVLGEISVGIFATKDMEIGQELSFNYQFDVYSTPFTRCLCGSSNCRKYLGLVPQEYTPEEWFDRVENMPCEICGSNDVVYDDQFLLCDNCNLGFHTFCLEPKLDGIPDGSWFCPTCVKKDLEEKELQAKEERMALEEARNNPHSVKHIKVSTVTLENILRMDKESKKRKLFKGRPRKIKEDPTEEDLADYNEWFNLQKDLQMELISQIDKGAVQEYQKEEEEAAAAEINPVESEESEDEEEDAQQTQKLSLLEENRNLIMKVLNPLLEQSGLIKKIRQKKYLAEMNENTDLKRRTISVSTIELSIFKLFIFRQTNKMNIRLSYDTILYQRDLFDKKNEFRIQCNEEQFEWFREIFSLMDQAINFYKRKSGFTHAVTNIPAIFLKRVIGEYQKTVHYIQSQFQVDLEYDKSFVTDECYPMKTECKLQFKGTKENIVKALEYVQTIIDEIEVRRIYMKSSEIKVIIANLMPIKQQIHPSEIRCSRDNALRDINHPFYTIYYKSKEVAFVGTASELEKSIALVENEISREKQIKKNIFSINYLIPVCDKHNLISIKDRIERDYSNTKLIIYDPLLPRKNVSLTLSSNYLNFDRAYNDLKNEIDSLKLFSETFESYQKSALYQMCKYFFKYLQNYFQTNSTIFMKAWDTITLDFLVSEPLKGSLFEKVKYNFSKDHELKFYILSVTQMPVFPGGNPSRLGLSKSVLVQIIKTILNKLILFDPTLYSKNFQSIFSFTPSPDQMEEEVSDSKFENQNLGSFLSYYNPKRYADKLKNHYGSDYSSLEEEIQSKIMTQEEMETEKREKRRERERRDEISSMGYINKSTKFVPKEERPPKHFRNSGERNESEEELSPTRKTEAIKPFKLKYRRRNSSSLSAQESKSRDRNEREKQIFIPAEGKEIFSNTYKDPRGDVGHPRDPREVKETRDSRDRRDPRETRVDPRNSKDIREFAKDKEPGREYRDKDRFQNKERDPRKKHFNAGRSNSRSKFRKHPLFQKKPHSASSSSVSSVVASNKSSLSSQERRKKNKSSKHSFKRKSERREREVRRSSRSREREKKKTSRSGSVVRKPGSSGRVNVLFDTRGSSNSASRDRIKSSGIREFNFQERRKDNKKMKSSNYEDRFNNRRGNYDSRSPR